MGVVGVGAGHLSYQQKEEGDEGVGVEEDWGCSFQGEMEVGVESY